MLGKEGQKVIDLFLVKLFSDPKIIKIGFSWGCDQEEFHRSFPDLAFHKYIANLVDAQQVYSQIKQSTSMVSLKVLCKEITNKDLCKMEQCSNWESRPLRPSQVHYAALDAYLLIPIMDALTKMKGYEQKECVVLDGRDKKYADQVYLDPDFLKVALSKVQIKSKNVTVDARNILFPVHWLVFHEKMSGLKRAFGERFPEMVIGEGTKETAKENGFVFVTPDKKDLEEEQPVVGLFKTSKLEEEIEALTRYLRLT